MFLAKNAMHLILCPFFGNLENCHTLQTQIDSKDNIAFYFCVNAVKTWTYVYLPLSTYAFGQFFCIHTVHSIDDVHVM